MPYRVIVQTPDDIEYLLLMAYAAANAPNRHDEGSTEHWDEPCNSNTAIWFVNWRAAIGFRIWCFENGISCWTMCTNSDRLGVKVDPN
jgi:hypothetical protein